MESFLSETEILSLGPLFLICQPISFLLPCISLILFLSLPSTSHKPCFYICLALSRCFCLCLNYLIYIFLTFPLIVDLFPCLFVSVVSKFLASSLQHVPEVESIVSFIVSCSTFISLSEFVAAAQKDRLRTRKEYIYVCERS